MKPLPTLPAPVGPECLSNADLQQFAGGSLPPILMSQIESHIDRCERCGMALDAWDNLSDPLIATLDQWPDAESDEPAYTALRHRLLTERPFGGGEASTLPQGEAPHALNVANPLQLGEYLLLDRLGQGGSGTVYRARHVRLDRIFAVKVLHRDYLGNNSATVERFRQEMRAIGQLDHPHIVRATDASEQDGHHYLVMEYVEGLDLSHLLRRVGTLRIADAAALIRQAATALACAHAHHLVHRDVKLSNLFFTVEGSLKLLDLGLVGNRSQEPEPGETNGSAPHGTAEYMSPEQWKDFGSVDGRADLYSLGCALFKLLTGRSVFLSERHDYATQRMAHLLAPAPALRTFRPEAPLGLQKILAKMLAKRPDDRYSSAEEVAERLAPYAADARLDALGQRVAALVADRPPHEHPSSTMHDDTWSAATPSRRTWLLGASATVGTLCCGWWNWSQRQPAPRLQTDIWRPLRPTDAPLLFPSHLASHTSHDTALPSESAIARSPAYALDARRQELSFHTAIDLLLPMGQPVAGRFTLQAEVGSTSKAAQFGWYFRFRPYRSRTGLIYPCQALLASAADASSPGLTLLRWVRLTYLRQPDATFRRELEVLAESLVPSTSPPQLTRLSLTLGVSAFPQVAWGEQTLRQQDWTMTYEGRFAAQIPREELEQAFLGRVGIVAQGEQIHFRKPALAYHMESRPRGGP